MLYNAFYNEFDIIKENHVETIYTVCGSVGIQLTGYNDAMNKKATITIMCKGKNRLVFLYSLRLINFEENCQQQFNK